MSLDLTPEGRQAYDILRWAQEDPEHRAAQAQRRIAELARPLLAGGGQALREVQDAGKMAARLVPDEGT